MNKLKGKIIICIAMLCLASNFVCYAKPTIKWSYKNFPPACIVKDKKVSGIVYDIDEILRNKLKNDYNFQFVFATLERLEKEMAQGNPYIYSVMIKNKRREKFMRFSLPWAAVNPHVLCILKKDKNKFKPLIKNGTISLYTLLKSNKLKGARGSVNYGKSLNDIFVSNKDENKLKVINAKDYYSQLTEMLVRERTDYIIGYSFAISAVAQMKEVKDKITFIPITESNRYIVARIAGPKNNKECEKFIKDVNKFICNESNRMYKNNLRIIDPSLREEFTINYNKIVGQEVADYIKGSYKSND